MAESIRISNQLYAEAQTAAALQNRSLAQQVEHWARIGQASEAVQSFEFETINIKLKAQTVSDVKAIQEGRLRPAELMLLKPHLTEKLAITFPDFDAAAFQDDYA